MNLEKHRRHFLLNMNRSFQDRLTSSLGVAFPEIRSYFPTISNIMGSYSLTLTGMRLILLALFQKRLEVMIGDIFNNRCTVRNH